MVILEGHSSPGWLVHYPVSYFWGSYEIIFIDLFVLKKEFLTKWRKTRSSSRVKRSVCEIIWIISGSLLGFVVCPRFVITYKCGYPSGLWRLLSKRFMVDAPLSCLRRFLETHEETQHDMGGGVHFVMLQKRIEQLLKRGGCWIISRILTIIKKSCFKTQDLWHQFSSFIYFVLFKSISLKSVMPLIIFPKLQILTHAFIVEPVKLIMPSPEERNSMEIVLKLVIVNYTSQRRQFHFLDSVI